MPEHEKEQRTSNAVALRTHERTLLLAGTNIRLKKSKDQWQPLSEPVRRLLARMFVEQEGGPHG